MPKDDGSNDAQPPGASRDVALIHGITPEGDVRVLRQRDDRLEVGAIRPLREGVPVVGEIVRLTPRKEFPLLCDVTTELTLPPAAQPKTDVAAAAERKGPAQVATDRYRDNWDVIWNRATRDDRAN